VLGVEGRTTRLSRAALLQYGFYLALAGIVVAGVDGVIGHSGVATVARLAAGVVLLAEGLPLALDRWGLRRAVADRFAARGAARFALRPLLFLCGFAFAGAGVYELLRAGQDVF